jgi:O-antigen/teichoic acid export membrane protein
VIKLTQLQDHILRYAGANTVRQGLGLITSFLRPKLLGPELFGLWSLLAALPLLAGNLHLGARSHLRYEIARLKSSGDEATLARLMGTVRLWSLLPSLFLAAGLVVAGLWPGRDDAMGTALVASALVVLATWALEHHMGLLKGLERYPLIAAGNVVRALLLLILTVVLIPLWGLAGAFAALIISLGGTALFIRLKHTPPRHGSFDATLLIQSLKQGFPVLAMGLVPMLLRVQDRVLVGANLEPRELGYYGLGAMILGALLNLPGVSREVMEPRLMARVGQEPPEGLLDEFYHRPLIFTAWGMPLLLGPVWILLPLLLTLFLPSFLPALESTRLLILGGFFLALSYPSRGVIVAYRRQVRAALLCAVAIPMHVVLALLLLQQGWGIEGVAVAGMVAFAMLYLLTLCYVLHGAGVPPRQWVGKALTPLIPFGFMVLTLYASESLAVMWLDAPWGQPLLGLVLFMPPMALLAWRWGRQREKGGS